MRLILFIFILFTGFSSSAQAQQDTSFFKIEKIGNVVFLEPKLPQAPADTSHDCEFEYDDEYMESFFQKIDSIVRQIGIFETLKNEKVELSFSFNEQGEIFYCYFFFRSEQSLAKFNIQTLKEFVEKLILLKLDMQYIYINYNRLAYLGRSFTYCEFDNYFWY